MSLLGRPLLGQKKYTDAEPLLLAGYEGMKKREAKITAQHKIGVTEALERLVQLYEATEQKDKAASQVDLLEFRARTFRAGSRFRRFSRYFKPKFSDFADVGQGLVERFALGMATGQCRYRRGIPTDILGANKNFEFHVCLVDCKYSNGDARERRGGAQDEKGQVVRGSRPGGEREDRAVFGLG